MQPQAIRIVSEDEWPAYLPNGRLPYSCGCQPNDGQEQQIRRFNLIQQLQQLQASTGTSSLTENVRNSMLDELDRLQYAD
jgi:hypothetical protein